MRNKLGQAWNSNALQAAKKCKAVPCQDRLGYSSVPLDAEPSDGSHAKREEPDILITCPKLEQLSTSNDCSLKLLIRYF